ncbi:DUF6603 domain-containing protein [Chitinophaga nivalis]|uniref:DUF6603 domain-containing protein n=1 Tax=Chitinophaga nivalis TaxID=2991709 RepID=A0ABT3IK16_9BACT|nr:DUF6603 domain-containing protein [Chitinophaga nivalis]MCW3466159.1 hypothetical protein [Chitinophaga nivalis]MCW3484150.1 hypothetical protein [Chitinophaga nivalis]
MSDIATLTPFSTIVQQIAAKQDILLDANLVGQLAIGRFGKEITPDPCVLSNSVVVENGASYLYLSGTIKNILSCADISTDILLFDIDNATAGVRERNLILFLHLPATFSPDELFRHFKQVGETTDNLATDETALLEFGFSDQQAPVLFFSSTDSVADFMHYPAAFEALRPWKAVIKGTACNLTVTPAPALATVFNFLSLSGSFNVTGNIDGDTNCLSLIYPLQVTQNLGPFHFTLYQLHISLNLALTGISLPAVGLSGHVDFGIATADLAANIDIIGKELSFAITDIHVAMAALDTFSGKFAGTALSGFLPGALADAGSLYVTILQAVIALEEKQVTQIGFQLTTEKPIAFIDDVITVTPYFTFQIGAPFDADEREIAVRIDGAWELGTSFFDVAIVDTFTAGKADYLISGALRMGQTLDIGALTDKIIGKEVIPAGLVIADFEFEASVNSNSLEVSLDVLSDWELELGGAAFAIQEVDMSFGYASKQLTECTVYGRLELFSLDITVSGEYYQDSGWVISGGLAPDEKLEISALLRNIIGTFSAARPTALMDQVQQFVGDVTVESLLMIYSVQPGTFSLFAELDNVLHFPCLSINKVITQVDITDHVLTGNCLINLQIGGADIFLRMEKKDDGWIFAGGLPENTTLPAGKLTADLFAKFTGVRLPEFLSGISITLLYITYNTANQDYTFQIKGTMKIGASTPDISLDTSMTHGADQSYAQKIKAVIVTRTSLADMAVAFGFNGTALPGILEDLVFSGMSFSYDSVTGITEYTGEGDLTIEGQTVALQLAVRQSGNTASYAGNFIWLPDTDDKNSGLHFLLESTQDVTSSLLALSLVFTIKGVRIDLRASATSSTEAGMKISDQQFSGGTNHLRLSVTDVLDELLQFSCPDYKTLIPVGFLPDIIIQDIFITYDGSTRQTDVVALVTVDDKAVKIFFQHQAAGKTLPESRYVFGITADLADLGQLPLVGGELQAVSLNGTGFVYTSGAGDFFLPEMNTGTAASGATPKLVLPAAANKLGKGLNLMGAINLPGQPPFSLLLPSSGVNAAVPATPAPIAAAPAAAETGPMVKWFQFGQKMGPLTVNRLGFAYNLHNSKKIALLLEADLAAGGLVLGLEGMGVSILPGDLFQGKIDSLSFELSGIGLTFEKGPVEISGAFTRTTQQVNNVAVDVYNGGVILKMQQCMITGIGSYAKTGNDASLFVYGLYEGNIGGPCFFFVTGIAVGFGYNRKVNIPAVNEVHQFPLVAMAMQPDTSKGILDILRDLETADSAGNLPIAIATGEYWLAAGIKFTSFKIIESFVLLTVNFGHDVEFAILGLSRLKWPEQSISPSPIVYIELAVLAHFGPGSAVIAVEGILTPNSYLFSRDCILTGGFACYTWVSGQHEGDFVITLGGYHPRFKKPDHYPSVPRLGYVWRISSMLSITGEMYYALTPTAIMAGGRMEVLFQIPVLSASLTVWADMLISWAPFQYYLDIGVCVKIDAHISIAFISIHFSLEMAAELHIWGPPFAGEAYVDWTIFSFTIPFGASEKTAPVPLEWNQFAGTYLPPAPINTVISRGIIKQIKDPADNRQVKYTIINPHELELTVDAVIPATDLLFNGAAIPDTIPMRSGTGTTITRNNVEVNNTYAAREKEIGIRPCGLGAGDQLVFSLSVTVSLAHVAQAMTISCMAKGVTDALWGSEVRTTDNQQPGTAKVIKNVLTGLTIRPPLLPQVSSVRELDFSRLFDLSEILFSWNQEMAVTGKAYHAYDVFDTIKSSYVSKEAVSERNRLLSLFGQVTGVTWETDITEMNTIMTAPGIYFKAPPVLCQTGEIPQYPTDTQ